MFNTYYAYTLRSDRKVCATRFCVFIKSLQQANIICRFHDVTMWHCDMQDGVLMSK